MNDFNFTLTYVWMEKLNLKKSEEKIYALIFGFCQGNDKRFIASYEWLSKRTNYSKRQVITTVENLKEMKLIYKSATQNKIGGFSANIFQINYECELIPMNIRAVIVSSATTSPLVVKKVHKGGSEINAPLYKDNTFEKECFDLTNTSTKENTPKGVQKKGIKSIPFTPPTVEDLKLYADSIGYKTFDPQHFFEYYASRDWKLTYKNNWKSTIKYWQNTEHKVTSGVRVKGRTETDDTYDYPSWLYETLGKTDDPKYQEALNRERLSRERGEQ